MLKLLPTHTLLLHKKKELMPCTGEKISMWGNLSLHTTTTVPIFFLVTVNYPLFPCISRVAPLVVVREPSRQIMMAVIWINRVRMNRRSFLLLKWNIYQHTPSWRYYHFTMSCHIYQETSLIIFCQTNFLQALLHVHIANNLFLILFEKKMIPDSNHDQRRPGSTCTLNEWEHQLIVQLRCMHDKDSVISTVQCTWYTQWTKIDRDTIQRAEGHIMHTPACDAGKATKEAAAEKRRLRRHHCFATREERREGVVCNWRGCGGFGAGSRSGRDVCAILAAYGGIIGALNLMYDQTW